MTIFTKCISNLFIFKKCTKISLYLHLKKTIFITNFYLLCKDQKWFCTFDLWTINSLVILCRGSRIKQLFFFFFFEQFNIPRSQLLPIQLLPYFILQVILTSSVCAHHICRLIPATWINFIMALEWKRSCLQLATKIIGLYVTII